MSLVEGVGDEVTLALVAGGALLLLALAWMSTWVRPALRLRSGVWLVPVRNERGDRRVIGVREATGGRVPTGGTVIRAGAGRSRSGRETTVRHMLVHTLDDTTDSDTGAAASDTPPTAGGAAGVDETGHETSAEPEAVTPPPTETSTVASGAPTPAETTIRIKFLDETQRTVHTWLSSTVGQFKREHFVSEVHEGKSIRLIYRGQLLRDESRSLASYGLEPQCTLHCHVSHAPYATGAQHGGGAAADGAAGAGGRSGAAAAGGDSPIGMEIGRYMHVLFMVKFSVLWIVFFAYPQYFDFSAFFSLILCSAVYVAFVYSSVRRRHADAHASAQPPPQGQQQS